MNITVQTADGNYYSVPIAELIKGLEKQDEVVEIFENFNTSEFITSISRNVGERDDSYTVILNRAKIDRVLEVHGGQSKINEFKRYMLNYLPSNTAFTSQRLHQLLNEGDRPFTFKTRKGIFFTFKVIPHTRGQLKVTTDRTYASMKYNPTSNTRNSIAPLPNIYGDARLCWGNRKGMSNFTIQDLSELNRIPDLFLASEFNNDLTDIPSVTQNKVRAVLEHVISSTRFSEELKTLARELNNNNALSFITGNAYNLMLTMNLFNLDYDVLDI